MKNRYFAKDIKNMKKVEVINYLFDLLKSSRVCEKYDNSLYWGTDCPENMDAYTRVHEIFIPSYENVVFIMKAYETYEEVRKDEVFNDLLVRSMFFSTARGFKGTSYESMEYFRKTMQMFLENGVDRFVESYPNLCPRFTEQFSLATGFIMDMAEFGENKIDVETKEYKKLYQYKDKSITWKYAWVSEIDEGIRDIVVKLNIKGYKTIASCEGHPERDEGYSNATTCIVFDKRYDFPVTIPFDGNEKGIKFKSNKARTAIYFETRKSKVLDKKIQDKKEILEALTKWVDELSMNTEA